MTIYRVARNRAPIAFLAVLGALWALAPELRSQADFRADSNLVVLQVTVTDRRGPVGVLPESAFHIYEDGVPQTPTLFRHEDVPVAVGLVVDNSGSMERKLPDVVAAADVFARTSNPEDRMFVVNFNEHVTLGLPVGEAFVSSPDQLRAAMLRIQARGRTALYDAVALALDHIAASTLQKKVLIVVSDGGDNASKLTFARLLLRVQRSDVVIYTVGLFDEYNTDRNPGVLRQLAKASGGEAFFPDEIPNVVGVLKAVSHDIRNQYTLGYISTNTTMDGTYRGVRVAVGAPHSSQWIVRTRAGYFAPRVNSTP
jgi:VWFA-related protein